MRSLVKGDSSLPCCDEPSPEQCSRARRRYFVRRLIALASIGMATFFAYEFFSGWLASSEHGLAASPNWSDPSDVLDCLRSRVSGLRWQLREAVSGALPVGDIGLIVKVAVCAVAAAAFLRVPRRT